jgi:hypothetical protein
MWNGCNKDIQVGLPFKPSIYVFSKTSVRQEVSFAAKRMDKTGIPI